MNLVNKLKGLNLDIAPKAIISPKGKAPTKVTIKSFNVCTNPAFNAGNTMGICSNIKSMFVLLLSYITKNRGRVAARPLISYLLLISVLLTLLLHRMYLHIPALFLLRKLLQSMHLILLLNQNLYGNQHRILRCLMALCK